ncbi:MAG: hypothetical protein GX637_01525, partial [Clostridiales bacterium]|nr:hypothetical protein [Clostridiales bacterium]
GGDLFFRPLAGEETASFDKRIEIVPGMGYNKSHFMPLFPGNRIETRTQAGFSGFFLLSGGSIVGRCSQGGTHGAVQA